MIGTMHRAGTYQATITTGRYPPTEFSKIRVTFSQDQVEVISKEIGDAGLVRSSENITVTLTQSETLLFRPSVSSPMGTQIGAPAFMQIRCYKNTMEAPASACWRIDVYDALNTEVLS